VGGRKGVSQQFSHPLSTELSTGGGTCTMYVWQMVAFCALALVSCVSLCVAVVAWSSCRRVTALLRSHSTRSALELSASLTALESSFESLSKTVRRLSARYGMAEHRAKDGTRRVNGELPLSELKGTEWRAAARAKYIRAGKPTQVNDE
jgi:hypothetical protein